MYTEVGAYLRELRNQRQISLSRLAERAQLAKGTLSYWESGRFQPRVPELEAALKALNATRSERTQAMALLDAPRSIRHSREAERRTDFDADAGLTPSIGDLLQALRRRAGKTPEQVAAALRVHPGTVRRWEKSEVVVPQERLDDLCRTVAAAPEERAALARRRLRLWTPGQDAALSPEAVEERCDQLQKAAERGETALMDLHLLSLEARLWAQQGSSAGASLSLARAYTTHAGYLEMTGRGREVFPYAQRAIDLLAGKFAPEGWRFSPVHAVGFVLCPEMKERRYVRRVAYLRQWLDFSDDPFWLSSLYRDMAQYCAEGRDDALALEYSAAAMDAAERSGEESATRLTRHIRVMVLLSLKRFADALPLLPTDNHPNIHQRVFEEMHWLNTLVGLKERDAAHVRLNDFYAFTRKHGISTGDADDIARRLE